MWGLNRRELLPLSAAGVTNVSASGWLNVLAAAAPAALARHPAVGGRRRAAHGHPRPEDGGAVGVSHAVSQELGDPEASLLNYVAVQAVDSRLTPGPRCYGAGYLGARHEPSYLPGASAGVANMAASVPAAQFDRRSGLLDELERRFKSDHHATASGAHQTTLRRAVALMRDRRGKASPRRARLRQPQDRAGVFVGAPADRVGRAVRGGDPGRLGRPPGQLQPRQNAAASARSSPT